MEKKWWHNKVVYQVYPRSFYDSNNDGVGDINGITMKLDYLESLGIDIIWLSPVYQSPMKDNGYDISDYYQIDPLFGDMKDMENLIAEAKKRNISIMMDLVVNHTSDFHNWFKESIKSKDNPYRDYYIWRDHPNELESIFGGSAWEYSDQTNQYYLHLFTKEQPDLNWENQTLRNEINQMISWWFEKGIAGFRLDVIEFIGKKPDQLITANGPKLHTYIKEMSKSTFIPHDAITVGEAWGASLKDGQLYSDPKNNELSMIFQFEHITDNWHPVYNKFKTTKPNIRNIREIMYKWQIGNNNGWNSLFWNNHDLARVNSRWGNDGMYNEKCAKAYATALHFMKGTPYIYQGEEIAMTNVKYQHIDDYNDVEIHNRYKEYVIEEKSISQQEFMQNVYLNGRDNARTPMQWNKTTNAGFSKATPWLRTNPNYLFINVEDNLQQQNSVFYHYRKLIQLRKSTQYSDVMVYGDFQPINTSYDSLFLYERYNDHQRLLVAVNLSEDTVSFDFNHEIKDILINTGNVHYFKTITLGAYDSIVISY
jgi:glycosidase